MHKPSLCLLPVRPNIIYLVAALSNAHVSALVRAKIPCLASTHLERVANHIAQRRESNVLAFPFQKSDESIPGHHACNASGN